MCEVSEMRSMGESRVEVKKGLSPEGGIRYGTHTDSGRGEVFSRAMHHSLAHGYIMRPIAAIVGAVRGCGRLPGLPAGEVEWWLAAGVSAFPYRRCWLWS